MQAHNTYLYLHVHVYGKLYNTGTAKCNIVAYSTICMGN